MSQNSSDVDFQQQLRVMQIILAALALGPLVFAVVVFFVLPAEGNGDGPMTKVSLIVGLGAMFLSGPVARLLRARPAQAGQPLGPYMTSMIISAAILEAGIFINLGAYMQERSPWSLAMAALLWGSMVVKFPTRTRVQAYLERLQRDLRNGGQQ